ncbi:membrane-associated guanylate WW and PDZ domain-containing 1-like isoform X2 [Labeo rohita]|uniref:Membrane-associated guanylate WW and PDZ domain-containing 1-like isoform X2 n=1 Tax=Labeo rohita TaxID=84645 RepID=A0A498MTR1_LABRO|nr:membrane-associated guanylate WW and PDZ domain-containing 1-like isoform X2 [Labeo rohita]
MLKSVPMGHSVDVVLRRGYPMLYNPDGCPKTSLASPSDPTSANPAAPGSAQTQVQHPDGHQTGLVNLNRSMSHHNNFYPRMQKEALDANGNTAPQPSYAMANGNGVGGTIGMGAVPSSNGPPPSERMSSSHSDTEVSSVVTRRASLVRSYNNNSLPAPSHAHHSSKSSESDLSSAALPLPQPEVGPAAPPGAPSTQRPPMPQTSLAVAPPTEHPPCGFNGCPANNPPRPLPGGLGSPGAPGGVGCGGGGELVPVALGRSEGGGMGFSVTAGGQGGQLAVVKRVWDRRQCHSLQPGDAIIKINGADVQSLSFAQVQRVLQEHTKQGEVVLLVYRGVRSYNNNSLPAPSHAHHSSKSSESDLSSAALPLPQPEVGPAAPPGAPSTQRPPMPQTSLAVAPPTEHPPCGFNGCPANNPPRPLPGGLGSPGAPGGVGCGGGGELVPVALGRSEGGGMGFSVTAGGQGGQLAVVKRVWDRRQCHSLQPGDAIIKINGADVQSLSFAQVQRVLQEHTKQGEVVLLVYRGGSPNAYKRPPPSLGTPDLTSPSSDGAVPSQSTLSPSSPCGDLPNLVQSTSFLDSVPVTLTLEPRDWIGVEDGPAQWSRTAPSNLGAVSKSHVDTRGAISSRAMEVELRRRPGEGFGFVIASQDVMNGTSSLVSHRFVTVRRGSPAARSGQIQPGDQLEAVEGRSVVTLPHRDLAQILRRAGNTLRLTIIPRSHTNNNLPEYPDFDAESRLRKGHRAKQKVSDQLVEINGDSTAGMTHSQAVEQIRKGGARIHLVLKKGNGYVPDYGIIVSVADDNNLSGSPQGSEVSPGDSEVLHHPLNGKSEPERCADNHRVP